MHTDPELLSLLALGEDAGTEDDRVHTRTCLDCAEELAELHWVVTLGRSASAESGLETPDRDVWARIRDELALEAAVEPPRPVVLATLPGPLTSGVRPDSAGSRLEAYAQLAPVGAGWSAASGRAELATDEHGRRLLVVALQAELPTTGVRQAWLVHRDDPQLRQSLGVLDGQHGLWTVPHALDLDDFSILDVSQQGIGETGHSGQTIVRGQLTLVS